MKRTSTLLSIKEASKWASAFLKRDISESNISYLIQYGKIKKRAQPSNGNFICVNVEDLKRYYDSRCGQREMAWKKRLGNDLNWALSFDHLREKDTTKHVHRLHPYKGKFIPHLVEYFIGP
ncbi:MAG: site-specific DNA-methyltransferase, partial [Pseudomonadota bacterium]